jgi:hypothetical protein
MAQRFHAQFDPVVDFDIHLYTGLGLWFEGMDVGKRIRMRLISTDVECGYIDSKKVCP